MRKDEYMTAMAEILFLNKPARNIYAAKCRSIISNTDFEKYEFGKFDFNSKIENGVMVCYTNKLNGKRQEIYFQSEQRLVNQVFRSLKKFEEKPKTIRKVVIPEIDINEDEIPY